MALTKDITIEVVHDCELALLSGEWSNSTPQSTITSVVKSVVECAFTTVLTSHDAAQIFGIRIGEQDTAISPLNEWFSFKTQYEGRGNELLQLAFGVACLRAFIQENWTGPDLNLKLSDVIQFPSTWSRRCPDEELNQKAVSELAFGGEPAYHLTRAAILLRLAQTLFSLPYQHCQSVQWWRFRAVSVHEQILDEPVPVPTQITDALVPLSPLVASQPDLAASLALERGLLENHFKHGNAAATFFVSAAKHSGLQYELTGALGKRTKFQVSEVSQLVLLAESRNRVAGITTNVDKPPSSTAEDKSALPETLALNDDTLLEQTEFTSSSLGAGGSRLGHLDPASQPPLHPLDQCILLSLCLNIQNTSPIHGLTSEQMSPYVARVISHPRNWSVHTMALLLRSRLESSRSRTVERSALQLQALVDQMPSTDSTTSERLKYIHALSLPSKWGLKKELALRFASLGVVKSALEIFEELEMWEDVAKCWRSMERPEKGVAIIRDLLEGRKEESEAITSRSKGGTGVRRKAIDVAREAKFWCLLGDLEPEHAQEHYEKAWVVSKETSGRAARSLGGLHFSRGNFEKAIEYLKKAVAINPLLSRSWFILGCACVRIELWDEARDAFGRCVTIDPEDGESWSNLASVYLRTPEIVKGDYELDQETDQEGGSASIPFSNKLLAFHALKQGVKYSFQNWRMWVNYMVVATDVGELSEACRAQVQIVEQKSESEGAGCVDLDVLNRLVNSVITALPGPSTTSLAQSPNGGVGLLPRVLELFERSILSRVSSWSIFREYGRLLKWQGRWDDACKANLDAYRCGEAAAIQRGEGDAEKWRRAVCEIEETVDVLQEIGPRAEGFNWKLQARSIVRTFMGKTRENFENDPEWMRLEKLQDDLR